jgi:hypothetical protein
MENIIVTYNVTDGCTYSATIVEAVAYESIEAFYVHFEEWLKKYSELPKEMSYDEMQAHQSFTVNNTTFEAYDFIEDGVYYMPDILLLEEWFNGKIGNLYD